MTLAYTRDSAGTGDNILELELVRNERHRNTEQDFNFRGLVSLQGKRFQWRKDKGVWKKYSGNSLINSALNWSRSVRLRRERSCRHLLHQML